jgi:hypothetical protein
MGGKLAPDTHREVDRLVDGKNIRPHHPCSHFFPASNSCHQSATSRKNRYTVLVEVLVAVLLARNQPSQNYTEEHS